jgi:hypothetical protein
MNDVLIWLIIIFSPLALIVVWIPLICWLREKLKSPAKRAEEERQRDEQREQRRRELQAEIARRREQARLANIECAREREERIRTAPPIRVPDEPAPGKYYYGSDRWKALSRRFRERNPTCKRCGFPTEVVHHVSYKRINTRNEWRDLEPLCTRCHNEAHGNFV